MLSAPLVVSIVILLIAVSIITPSMSSAVMPLLEEFICEIKSDIVFDAPKSNPNCVPSLK